MTAAVAESTRRARVLAHLEEHPGLTASDLGRVLGTRSPMTDLLRSMERQGQLAAARELRHGRPVARWFLAPPGTAPRPVAESPDAAARRRERERPGQRARRALARGFLVEPGIEPPSLRTRPAVAVPLPAAACRTADPRLFFPPAGEEGAEAKAICAGCPARAQCYALAVANAEPWGIWGGVDFAVTAGAASRKEATAS